jgi:hypothetical protein
MRNPRLIDGPVKRLEIVLADAGGIAPRIAERMQVDSHVTEAGLFDEAEMLILKSRLAAIAPPPILADDVHAPPEALVLSARIARARGK